MKREFIKLFSSVTAWLVIFISFGIVFVASFIYYDYSTVYNEKWDYSHPIKQYKNIDELKEQKLNLENAIKSEEVIFLEEEELRAIKETILIMDYLIANDIKDGEVIELLFVDDNSEMGYFDEMIIYTFFIGIIGSIIWAALIVNAGFANGAATFLFMRKSRSKIFFEKFKTYMIVNVGMYVVMNILVMFMKEEFYGKHKYILFLKNEKVHLLTANEYMLKEGLSISFFILFAVVLNYFIAMLIKNIFAAMAVELFINIIVPVFIFPVVFTSDEMWPFSLMSFCAVYQANISFAYYFIVQALKVVALAIFGIFTYKHMMKRNMII
ncbi:MAG: hypothetical protein IKL73_03205 [Lachnospiraceae bacterium]|nr:hypothetical protein [Lachnospiraceae bacterium]